MAAVKMNVLHLHLTDDQGFRIECKSFPKLHQLGSGGQYFTQEQIRDIIAYADNRGIRIVPEIDIPGHTTSWFVGYPELASGSGPYTIEHNYGKLIPAMNPANEGTYQFLDTLFKEMAAIFPDEYMHIGGDENNGIEWDANNEIQEFKKANNLPDNASLQAYFNKRILKILTKYGKKMIGWDEILQPGLPKTIVIQSWQKKGLINAVHDGFPVIFSTGYYIDLMLPAEVYYQNDPIPTATSLTAEQKNLILGGEATLWSELVTAENIDSRIWPRTAAIAERLWSPDTVKNVSKMYEKLDRISIQLEELGLTHEKNYEMMLRRLTGSYDITALKTLTDVLEPLKFYFRISSKETQYTTGSPLTHVVDAVRADARVARKFNALVDVYLENPNSKQISSEIKSYLKLWAVNHELLKAVIQKSPVLKEIEPHSAHLAVIAKIGLEAITYIENNQKPQSAWYSNNIAKIKQADKPIGQTELAMIKGIQKLVDKFKE
jgi:hexosaminidase